MTPRRPELWGVTEISQALGVTVGTVHNWAKQPSFPRPVRLAMGPVWLAWEVRNWRRRDVERRRHSRAF